MWEFPKIGVPNFGVLIIRIPLFRVLNWGPLFSETPMYPNSIYFGRNVPIKGVFEGRSIYYLVAWTLRVTCPSKEPYYRSHKGALKGTRIDVGYRVLAVFAGPFLRTLTGLRVQGLRVRV